MKIAYIDCFSGISGDMFVGALIDAGLPLEQLENTLRTLPLKGYDLEINRVERNHIYGTQFLVRQDNEKQERRNLSDIKKIIQAGALTDHVREKSIEIFDGIAIEEGKIHNLSPDEVHFHEVGALDSIIDIVGTVFGVEYLGIHSISVSSLPLGSGFVETAHGRIPVPAPATIALLKGTPVYDSGLSYELITPTGAALVTRLAASFGSMPPMMVDRVGYGAGGRQLPDRPNLLRIVLGDEQIKSQIETIVMLEANLDDTNPEWLGFLMDCLFEAGALDVTFCPVHMKKNRPGILIQVMGRPHQCNTLMDIIFSESTTLGVRFRYSRRKILKRSSAEIESPWGKLIVKKILRPDGSPFFLPEFETCRKIAKNNNLPLKDIYYWVISYNKS